MEALKKMGYQVEVHPEVGSFMISDSERDCIWKNRDILAGQVAEIRLQDITAKGAPRAGVFDRFHPSKSDVGLLTYSEGLAGTTDSKESRAMVYRLKSSAGWKK